MNLLKRLLKKYPIVITLIVLSAIYTSFKKIEFKPMETSGNNNLDFDKEFTKYLLKAEGGLSNDKTDSASSFPSPTPQLYHTNKGITYRTFVDSASANKYQPTVANFLSMPDSIWYSIYKNNYYNKAKSKNYTQNHYLISYLSLWYWGGWATNIVPTTDVKNILSLPISEKLKLRKLVDLRKLYFDKLVALKPSYMKYLKGWKNRAEEFYSQFNQYL